MKIILGIIVVLIVVAGIVLYIKSGEIAKTDEELISATVKDFYNWYINPNRAQNSRFETILNKLKQSGDDNDPLCEAKPELDIIDHYGVPEISGTDAKMTVWLRPGTFGDSYFSPGEEPVPVRLKNNNGRWEIVNIACA